MSSRIVTEPHFFTSPAEFRTWLATHHRSATELWVGYHKKSTGKPSLTWPESVDQALCFGWIDGVRRSLGAEAYTIRFTPRRDASVWSDRNLRRMEVLLEAGLVRRAGKDAYERRKEHLSRRYSFEQDEIALPPELEKRFRANRRAWKHFGGETASYRKAVTWWVVSARREETRLRRLDRLIEDSAAGFRIKEMRR